MRHCTGWFLTLPDRVTLREVTFWVGFGGTFSVLGGQANLRGAFAWNTPKTNAPPRKPKLALLTSTRVFPLLEGLWI